MTSLSNVAQRLYFHTQRSVLPQGARQTIASGIARVLRARESTRPEWEARADSEGLETLQEDGIYHLGPILSDAQIDEMKAYLTDKPCRDPYSAPKDWFQADQPPPERNIGQYALEDVVRCPHALDIANDPRILGLVQAFFGAKPTISTVLIWNSYANRAKTADAQNFHRDYEDFRSLKLFVYLSDVTEDAGPHIYVRGSHREPKLLRIRRYSDSEVASAFRPEDILRITGARGSAFIEWTYGVHKGLLPKDRNRLLFQVDYTLLPLIDPARRPVAIERNDLDPFVNRLIVS